MKANKKAKINAGIPANKVSRTERMLLALDPEGTVSDCIPRIRLTGNSHAEIEKHKGVLEFGANAIRVYTALGIVKLTGEGLKIRLADRETVVCDGEISIIEYEKV